VIQNENCCAETPEEIFSKLMQVVLERIPQRFNLHPVNDIQVLTPMNRGGLGARSLNVELQQRLNGSSEPKVRQPDLETILNVKGF
jgi:exodeoxyribonuclease V alpha subunit